MKFSILLNKRLTRTLQDQIYDQFRTLILTGNLTAGTSLPPTRRLAERLGVSRNTVSIAYERLRAEGFISARGTAGTFVTATLADDWRSVPKQSPSSPDPAKPFLLFAGSSAADQDGNLDFWIGRADPKTFPIKIWKRLINRSLKDTTNQLTDYCDPAGLLNLRYALADYLFRARAMVVDRDQIIITVGEQEALDILVRLAESTSTRLCIEDPCYKGAAMIFLNDGRPVQPVPVNDDGIMIDRLPQSPHNLLYVSPPHQFPTGAMLPLERRRALLQWAESTDSLIIEDDYDGDFVYDRSPIAPLASLNGNKRVMYINEFSQTVGASVRVGYCVVPQKYAEAARELKGRMTLGQSWLEQEVLALFIHEGHLEKHLQGLRAYYKTRRDCLIDALQKNFDNPDLVGTEGGLHLVWRLPEGAPDASKIQTRARDIGVGVYALTDAASYSFGTGSSHNALVFGYSALNEQQIREAIRKLKDLLSNWPDN